MGANMEVKFEILSIHYINRSIYFFPGGKLNINVEVVKRGMEEKFVGKIRC